MAAHVEPLSTPAVTVPPPRTPAVTVPPLRSNLHGLLIPFGVWIAFRGGRLLCQACQHAMRLTPFAVPLPTEDALDLMTRKIR